MKRSTVVAGIVLGFGLITSVYFLPTVSSKGSIDAATVAETLIDQTNMVRVSNSMNDTTVQSDSELAFDASKFIKPSDAVLKEKLSGIEYKVTQKDGTERPFSNSLHEEKRTGLYVDIVSGEPLFSSSDKFDSGTGWPSFVRPLAAGVVVEKEDRSLFGLRTEIRSAVADSHLGHVFADGPAPTGNRYCMNAAAMRFIPLEDMLENGYGDYIERVTTTSS